MAAKLFCVPNRYTSTTVSMFPRANIPTVSLVVMTTSPSTIIRGVRLWTSPFSRLWNKNITLITGTNCAIMQRFSTFVTLWTPQKFQARVADPTAQGAPFVLLVGREHVLLRLRTQTTGILLNAQLRAQQLKVIAHILKLLLFQKFNNHWKYLPAVCLLYSVPFSGKAVPVSHYRVCPNVVVCVIINIRVYVMFNV